MFQSLAFGLAPLVLFLGIAALFGYNTFMVNGAAVHGPLGLLYNLMTIPFLAGFLATFQKLGYFILGQWPRREADVEA